MFGPDGKLDFDVSAHAPLPALRGLLVTGTDTEVGKTLIAGAIVRSLRRNGTSVEVFKPAASACRRSRGELVSADAEFLAACADSRLTLSEIAPLRYAAPLAPNAAAAREGVAVDLDAIFDAYRRLEGLSEIVIVEGVGGLLCPISDDFGVIHFARMLAMPLVIVARAGLGTINHTLLTIHAARSAGLRVAGVVINRCPSHLVPAEAEENPAGQDADLSVLTNPGQIALRAHVPILAVVPDEPANSVENATIGPDTQFAIDQAPWADIADCGALE